MRIYRTEIEQQDRSAGGKLRVQTFHLDDNFYFTDDLHQALALSLVEQGGTGRAGVITSADRAVTVDGRAGVTLDGATAVRSGRWVSATDTVVDDASVNFNSDQDATDLGTALNAIPNGTLALLTLIPGQVVAVRQYVDRESSETILHEMTVRLGQLQVIEGTLTAYPAAPQGSLPVAELTVGATAVTIDRVIDDPPTLNAAPSSLESLSDTDTTTAPPAAGQALTWSGSEWMPGDSLPRIGATTERPGTAGLPAGRTIAYFDTTLGKPIWWSGSAWVDATGAAV